MVDRRGHSAPCLYARLLGESWADVHESIRCAHEARLGMRAVGTFRIVHSRNVIGRMILWVCRLPSEGSSVATRLAIRRIGDDERWVRRFGRRIVVSKQRWVGPHTFCERFGMLELTFHLAVHRGGLRFAQTGAAIVIGPIRVPLPRHFGPRVEAIEQPDDQPERMRVSVKVELPGIGHLFSYDGVMRSPEVRP